VTAAMTDKTILVTIMLANNESRVVQPIEALGAAIKAKNPKTLFHTDAVQGFGKVPFDVEKARVDLASVTAHKLYGPKGIGALWVRASRGCASIRSSMRRPRARHAVRHAAVPLIAGFRQGGELAREEMAEESAR